MSTEAIHQAIRVWTAEPEKAFMKPMARGRSEGAKAVIEAGPFTMEMDAPPPFGGTNQAPSPVPMLLGALAGCAVLFIKDTLAPQYGVAVEDVESTVQCEADGRGSYGIDDALPDIQNVSMTIRIKSSDTEENVEKIYQAWLERCPIYLAMIKPLAVETNLEIVR